VSFIRRQLVGSSFPFFADPVVAVPPTTWTAIYSKALTSVSASWSAWTVRQVVSVYDVAAGQISNQLRVTLTAPPSGSVGMIWNKAYIGHAAVSGDAWDFDGTQVQLLFSGVAGGSLGVAASVISDPISYPFNSSKPLVASIHFSGSTNLGMLDPAPAGFTTAWLLGDDAASTDAVGYGSQAGQFWVFTKVEANALTTPSWYTLYTRTITGAGGGWSNANLRQVVPTAAYDGSVPSTGGQLRVTLQSDAFGGFSWTSVYVGHAAASGDPYDFDGTQVQLLFSGSASGSVAIDSSIVSDAVNYAFDKTKPLVIAMFVTGSGRTCQLNSGVTGFVTNIKTTGGDNSAVTDATGYSVTSDVLSAFPKVEVWG
jgi:hypothetical protein